MRKLKHRDIKELAQGHTASKWQSWGLKLGFRLCTLNHLLFWEHFSGFSYRSHSASLPTHAGRRTQLPFQGSLGLILCSVVLVMLSTPAGTFLRLPRTDGFHGWSTWPKPFPAYFWECKKNVVCLEMKMLPQGRINGSKSKSSAEESVLASEPEEPVSGVETVW